MAETPIAPRAGPAEAPAPRNALAKPRSEAGNHSLMMRLQAGQHVDSPMPMATRVVSMNRKLGATPVNMVAADHRPIPELMTILPPNRSASIPTGIRQTMYIQRKDDNR